MTSGDLLNWNSTDNSGTSGNWKFNPYNNRNIKHVIIYLRNDATQYAEIIQADYNGIEVPSITGGYDTPDRYLVRLKNMRKVGVTGKNWKQFADAGTNPVRFLSNYKLQ